MLYLLYFADRGSVKMMQDWQKDLEIYIDFMSVQSRRKGKMKVALQNKDFLGPNYFVMQCMPFFKVTQIWAIFLLGVALKISCSVLTHLKQTHYYNECAEKLKCTVS